MSSVKRIPAFYLILSTIILVIITGVILRISTGSASPDKLPGDEIRSRYPVFALDLPGEVYFAGERVPLEQIDVKENLDRELLVNTYWQSQTLLFIKRANRYFPVIEPILKKYGIPDDFKYLAVAESGLTHAVSPANAVGFWQLLEGTAKDYGLEVNAEVDERYHIEKATEVACRYLLESYQKYGTWTLTAASYNIGRKGIDRQVERQKENDYYDLLLGEETGRYIYRVLSFKLIMENPSEYGFYLGENHLYPQIPYFEIEVGGKVEDFATFAKSFGISYKILKWMNPWLRETFLTNSQRKIYRISIPREGFFKAGSDKTDTIIPGSSGLSN